MTGKHVPKPRSALRLHKRLILNSFLAIALVVIGYIWIMNLGNVLSGILGVIFTLLSILLAVLQWNSQYAPTGKASNEREGIR